MTCNGRYMPFPTLRKLIIPMSRQPKHCLAAHNVEYLQLTNALPVQYHLH